METSYQTELLQMLTRLENLNPDLRADELDRLVFLARNVGSDFFDIAAQRAMKLGKLYVSCDVKLAGETILSEYFHMLDKGAKLLRESGEITAALPPAQQSFSTALVPREQTEALDFCKILNRSVIPKPLVKAADAFRRRNAIVATVFELAMKVLWTIDADKTAQWVIQLYSTHDGSLDPDIVRDTLSTALESNCQLTDAFHQWIFKFAADQNLLEYWPTVTHYADRLICNCGLRAWLTKKMPRNSLLAQLALHVRSNRLDETTILEWSRQSLNEIGNCVQRFMALDNASLDAKWLSTALLSELKRISALYTPALLVAHQMMELPDGANQLAMAFMGLAGEARDKWEEDILRLAQRAVKIMFMLDMKKGRKPLDTIRLLTFGDDAAYNQAFGELDLASQNFESPRQRDKVAKYLSIFYASYRRPQLLAYEIAKRYKNLMRLIHEDFLAQKLDPQQMDELKKQDILPEIASIAAEARKFLQKRKTDENTLEQLIAAKIAFERFVRQKRIQAARKLLAQAPSET